MWFSDDRQQLIRTVASSLGLALANLRLRDKLRQQSIRDLLTGLFNRRYLEETIAREIHRVDRNQHPLGVIMIDVDHFKRFNDTHGHEAGDIVLREMGVFLRSQVRGEDIPCRYGGEEFVLILPDAPLEVTKLRAEKLRAGIQQLNLVFKDQPLGSISVSLGVAVYPEHGSTADAVIRAADAALYRAKRAGRNRVAVAEID
jgi:diguanylate cyclase (GGDEF)-like protein